jgi:branched-chain amino acid aminotransferase
MIKAINENRMYEAFGAGTAVIVSPVESFKYQGQTHKVPIDKEKGAGKLTQRILKELNDIQYGRTKRPEWQFDVCAK